MQIYVNQHDFFISKDRVLEEAAKQEADATEGEGEEAQKQDMSVQKQK